MTTFKASLEGWIRESWPRMDSEQRLLSEKAWTVLRGSALAEVDVASLTPAGSREILELFEVGERRAVAPILSEARTFGLSQAVPAIDDRRMGERPEAIDAPGVVVKGGPTTEDAAAPASSTQRALRSVGTAARLGTRATASSARRARESLAADGAQGAAKSLIADGASATAAGAARLSAAATRENAEALRSKVASTGTSAARAGVAKVNEATDAVHRAAQAGPNGGLAATASRAAIAAGAGIQQGANLIQRLTPAAVRVAVGGIILIALSLVFPWFEASLNDAQVAGSITDSRVLRGLSLIFLAVAGVAVHWLHRRRSLLAAITTWFVGKAAIAVVAFGETIVELFDRVQVAAQVVDIPAEVELGTGAYLQSVGGVMLLVAAAIIFAARTIDHLRRASQLVTRDVAQPDGPHRQAPDVVSLVDPVQTPSSSH